MPVVYVAGYSRSGTTLLGQLLDAVVPDATLVGEVVQTWSRGVLANQRCGCGVSFRDCPFWRRVMDETLAGCNDDDVRAVHVWAERITRARSTALASPRLRRSYPAFVRLVARLYSAVAEVSGCSHVVDTSKLHGQLGLLKQAGLDVRVAAIIRDPRAVAYSQIQRRAEPADATGRLEMGRRSAVGTSGAWVRHNTLIQRELAGLRRTTQVAYESLISDPSAVLSGITDALELPRDSAAMDLLRDRTFLASPAHTVSGNPVRFADGGPTRLTVDDRWLRNMDAADRRSVEVLTRPFARRLGVDLGRSD